MISLFGNDSTTDAEPKPATPAPDTDTRWLLWSATRWRSYYDQFLVYVDIESHLPTLRTQVEHAALLADLALELEQQRWGRAILECDAPPE